MKRVRCPKCDHTLTFDETRYRPGQTLVFDCPECHHQFGIKVPARSGPGTSDATPFIGKIIVVENVFHYRQEMPLHMGDNTFGRYVKGIDIDHPIQTADPSVDTTHCIIRVQHNKRGDLEYVLRDAPSGTGTFVADTILRDNDRLRISDGTIISIGATTLILSTKDD